MKIKEITLKENYKVIKNDPQTGIELVDPAGLKMIIPPEQALAIQSNPQDPKKFTMNPDMVASSDQQQPQGPQVGTEVELPTDEIAATETFNTDDLIASHKNHHIGGDASDDLINDVVDHDFEKHAGRSSRNFVKPEPMRESEDLLAMLTIAGLR